MAQQHTSTLQYVLTFAVVPYSTIFATVSFIYPLFLIAGVSLVIPVLIHLFNLRKYKTVLFPHTRFLKNIQLNSRKQSQIRYKALLAARLLFLTCLILAFAQPFFNNGEGNSTDPRLQVVYLDNSNSMGAKKGARSLLEIAKEAAAKQVRAAKPGTRFVLLTNDKPTTFHAEPADKVYEQIQAVELSATPGAVNKVMAMTQTILQNESSKNADLYYYSDFQQSGFAAAPPAELTEHITFHGLPVQPEAVENIYIDTAYLTTPVLQAERSNYVVVHTRSAGKAPKENPVLNLSVNGQVKSAASLDFSDGAERTDTLNFQVSGSGWQQISLNLNDAYQRFDDTFRIAARCAPNLSVLVLNEGQLNPYIQASFRAYNGFRLNQADVSAIPADRKQYNLIILNGVTRIDESMGKMMADALENGQTICIFPGRTNNLQQLNEGLKLAGGITFAGIDTAMQTASLLQQGSALVKDLFEQIPDNVQLPVANWHYVINADLGANQQTVLGFRNGDPLLARYTPGRGQLYICATSADIQSGNFPGSYFFTPFLYLMATQNGGGSVFAVAAGSKAPTYLALSNVSERNTLHVIGKDADIIPPQKPNGAGIDVYVGQAVQQPGFYVLAATGSDTTQVALNQNKSESIPAFRDIAALQKEWTGKHVKWMTITDGGTLAGSGPDFNFPLWKVCVILSLIMLGLETLLLTRTKVSGAYTT